MIGEGSRGRTGLMTRLRGARADAAHGSGQWGCAAWVCRGAWAGWLARSVSCTVYTQYIYIELRSICVVSTETPHPPTWVDLPTVQTFLQIGPTSGDGAPSRTPDGKQLHPGHMCPPTNQPGPHARHSGPHHRNPRRRRFPGFTEVICAAATT
jgi:hypothetical protein